MTLAISRAAGAFTGVVLLQEFLGARPFMVLANFYIG